jgi:hypothetical protein
LFFAKEISPAGKAGEDQLSGWVMHKAAYDPGIGKYVVTLVESEGKKIEIANLENDESRRLASVLLEELVNITPTERTTLYNLMDGVEYETVMENYYNNPDEKMPLIAALIKRLMFFNYSIMRFSLTDFKVEAVKREEV